jgi:hypothetical protein
VIAVPVVQSMDGKLVIKLFVDIGIKTSGARAGRVVVGSKPTFGL